METSLKPIEAILKLISRHGIPRVLIAVIVVAMMTSGIAYLGRYLLKGDALDTTPPTPASKPMPATVLNPTVLKDGCMEFLLDGARQTRDYYRADRFWVIIFQHDGSGEGSILGYRPLGFFSGICESTTVRMGNVLGIFQSSPVALLDGAFERAIKQGGDGFSDVDVVPKEFSAIAAMASFRGAKSSYVVTMTSIDGAEGVETLRFNRTAKVIGLIGIDFADKTVLEEEDLRFLVRQASLMSVSVGLKFRGKP